MLEVRTLEPSMPPTLSSLGIDQLSADDRIRLAYAIWESVDLNTDSLPLSEAEQAEVDRRLAKHRANPSAATPWEDFKAELLGTNGNEASAKAS